MKLQPTSDFIFIETYRDIKEGLILPDSAKGEVFRVLAVGPGFVNNQGKRVKCDVKVGDIVAIMGQIANIPFEGERYQLARCGDVVAYCRDSWEGLPDKI